MLSLFGRDNVHQCAFMVNVKGLWSLSICAFSSVVVCGQDRFVPTVENDSPRSVLPFGGNQPVTDGDDREVLVATVSGLLVTTGNNDGMRVQGVSFSGLTVDDQEALKRSLQPFLNRALTEKSLLTLTELIVSHYEENSRPVVDVWIPQQQEPDSGQLVVRVTEGRVGQVQIREPQHFDADLLVPALRVESGSLLHSGDLAATTSWLSRNPFRKAELFVAAGDGEGEADLMFAFEEETPWQVSLGYENTGSEATGENRFLLAAVWGNAFQHDHVLAYQATLGASWDQFQAHGLSWEVPLHHRHEFLRVTGSWAEVSSDAVTSLGAAEIEGSSLQLSASYGRQLIHGDWVGEVSGGFEFKRSDTFLTFSDFAAFSSDTPVEVAQFRLNVLLQNPAETASDWSSRLQASLVASPGDLSGRNNDEDFARYRSGADSSYLYLRGNGQWSRSWRSWTFLIRAEAQLASGSLLPSEQLGLGGLRTVRGYSEREALADSGWWGSFEARSPAWQAPLFQKELTAQGLLFVDHGFAWQDHANNVQLWSLGVGARVGWGEASLRADLGLPLIEGEEDDHLRAHLGLVYRW